MINRTQKLSRALISHHVMDYPLLYVESFGGKNRSLQVNGVLGEETWKEESVGIHRWLATDVFESSVG